MCALNTDSVRFQATMDCASRSEYSAKSAEEGNPSFVAVPSPYLLISIAFMPNYYLHGMGCEWLSCNDNISKLINVSLEIPKFNSVDCGEGLGYTRFTVQWNSFCFFSFGFISCSIHLGQLSTTPRHHVYSLLNMLNTFCLNIRNPYESRKHFFSIH